MRNRPSARRRTRGRARARGRGEGPQPDARPASACGAVRVRPAWGRSRLSVAAYPPRVVHRRIFMARTKPRDLARPRGSGHVVGRAAEVTGPGRAHKAQHVLGRVGFRLRYGRDALPMGTLDRGRSHQAYNYGVQLSGGAPSKGTSRPVGRLRAACS